MRRMSTPSNFTYGACLRACRTLAVTPRCPEAIAERAGSWAVGMFRVERVLGSGETSRVYAASFGDVRLALKTYLKQKMSALNEHHVRREIDIHSRIEHPHVVDMWGAFEDRDRFFILMELGKGDLKDLVDMNGGRFDEATTAAAMRQVLSALEHVHSLDIAHRDVKPENVIVAMDGTLKLADFGLSIDLSKERAVTRVGTLALMAPEVVACPCKARPGDNKARHDLWYGAEVDTWSCGVMAYELMTCKHLFNGPTTTSTMFAIAYRRVRMPAEMSDAARRFVTSAVHKLPGRRPSAGAMLESDYLCAKPVSAIQASFQPPGK